jgi:thiol-disulfide isomerase/thioredoxin
MSRVSIGVLMLLVMPLGSAAQFSAQSCEAPQSTREILAKLRVPQDPRKPAAERQAQELERLQEGLRGAPDDIFLHEAYQDLEIGRIGDQREAVIKEYEKLLAKHPHSPVFLYLAARAQYSRNTKRSIEDLEQALVLAPKFGLPHLLLAQIYSASAFSDPEKVAQHLDRFSNLCPSSVRVFPDLRWSKDRELISRTVMRVRKALDDRTDVEAEAAYPILWTLEAALERSDNQAENLKRVLEDAKLLQGKQFPRNTAWLSALETAADMCNRPALAHEAHNEVALLFPNSGSALWLAISKQRDENPYPRDNPSTEQLQAYWRREREIELTFAREWPGVLSVARSALRAAANDQSATPQLIAEAIDLFERALNQDPEGSLSFPPAALDAAEEITERRVRLVDVPALVHAGFALTDRIYSNDAKSDLYVGHAESAAARRDSWYLYGYFPLAEASIRRGQLPSAADTLLQIEDKIDNTRPRERASSGIKFEHAEMEARFWYLKGLYDEAEGRKLDALISYRNSIVTFPVRKPRPDRRDEVMQDAQRLWKQLGGTTQGWNDWAAQSSLRNFYAGSGEGNAWSQLARAKGDFVFPDSLGNRWKPEELSKKVTFVNLWASWCGPCRAELPYVEKLYQHFKGRSDVVVLALNIDDNPKAMDVALKELKVTLPSVSANDFAYEFLPTLALPANWIITPSKTEMFNATSVTLDGWLEEAIRACEGTGGSTVRTHLESRF